MSVPFGVYELVEFAAVGLHHAFTARQDVDLTCNRGTVRVIRLSCISAIHEIPVQSVEGEASLKNEGRGGEGMGIMSALKASALLHLPKDVKKESNGTIGYS